MDSGVLAREFVQGVRGRGIPRAGEDDGVGVSLEEGEDEVVADSSVGTGDCGRVSVVILEGR